MKKILFVIIIILLLNLSLVNAITQQEINEAKSFIDSRADCKSLSDSQLEIIGEYYMEQMHPGEAHELMHKMMGLEEGSEAEEQFHINMAKRLYCNENIGGMMGMMSGGMTNMMTRGQNPMQTSMMQGMMGNYWNYGFGWNIWSTLFAILIVGLIILVYLVIYSKAKRDRTKKKDNTTMIIVVLLALVLLFGFGWGFGYMGGMMFFGPLFMILVLVLIVWLIVSLTQRR